MSTFGREFPVEKITEQVLEQNAWFKDMLSHWRPAGDALRRSMAVDNGDICTSPVAEQSPRHLRLAVRNGYINLYRDGQSVAKIDFAATRRLQARIHNKYVHGDNGSGQTYVALTSAGLPDWQTGQLRKYGGLSDLNEWIGAASERARGRASKPALKEKQFVDLVVASNPDTIDIEMALPAYLANPEERRAPRMDLVALEPAGDRWRIVFWEAKLVDDPRLRCGDKNANPKVVDQLEQYTAWLDHDGHCALVAAAYQNACRLLVAFHQLAKGVNTEIEDLGPGIVAVAAEGAPPLLVDRKPRLLIDDSTSSHSFTKNGHLDKLRGKAGLHVQMVHSLNQIALEARL
jgi:hypothetical protein